MLLPLQGLKDFLRHQRSWLVTIQQSTSAVAGEGDSLAQTALLSGLVTGLLKCCDTESSLPVSRQAQQTCAQCLGMLGAIDPARLQVCSLVSSTHDFVWSPMHNTFKILIFERKSSYLQYLYIHYKCGDGFLERCSDDQLILGGLKLG